jgi:hypothetical protein
MGPEPRDTCDIGAHLGWKAGLRAAGHVVAPEPTWAGRQDPMLLDTWRRVDAHPVSCLDLKLARRSTRSAGYRQWPPDRPQERLHTRRWGQLFDIPLDYLELFPCQLKQ